MRHLFVLTLLALAAVAKGEAGPTTSPTTRPSNDVKMLIRQLGDDDPKLRNSATNTLKKIGKEALPALEVATKDEDPEVRTRAQAIIASIEGRDTPVRESTISSPGQTLRPRGLVRIAPGGMLQLQGHVQTRVSIMNNNGVVVRDVNISENGRQLHVHEDADGIAMEVTEKGETKSYKAKNAAELKEKEPEAYQLYERTTQVGGGEIRIETVK